jgi:hypothetical protein
MIHCELPFLHFGGAAISFLAKYRKKQGIASAKTASQ